MAYAPFPLIDLSGSPRERGRQHGKAVPDRIRRGIAMYSGALLKNGVEWRELERRAETMVPAVEAFDAGFVEEMRGIAGGSGEGHLEVCPTPALNRQFTTYSLTPDRAAQKRAAE